jgi:hypothetical protein
VVEWGRLLSGYRGEIFGRRFESCPPRFKKKRVHHGTRFSFNQNVQSTVYRILIQTQLHSQMCSFESKALIKSMRVCAGLVSG